MEIVWFERTEDFRRTNYQLNGPVSKPFEQLIVGRPILEVCPYDFFLSHLYLVQLQ